MKNVFIPLIIFSVSSTLIIQILFIVLIRKILVLKKVRENLNFEKQSYECLVSSYDGIRAFRHDFANIMQSISGYLITDDLSGLKSYYSSIFHECEEIKKLSIFNKDVLNSPPVLSIITEKYSKAQNLGIDFNIEVMTNLNSINMNIYDFTRILGIFLDNSIEASCKASKKVINIIFSRDSINHFDSLIIENSCPLNSTIDTKKIFEKDYSTKPKNTGLGLWKVRKIVNKYENVTLSTSVNDDYFKHHLKIYY